MFLLVYSLIAQGAEPLIRVGMTEGGHEKEHTQVFDETRDALIKKFGKENVSFDLIHVNQLVSKIFSGEVNFFISTTGLSRRLQADGARDLVTLTSKRFPNPNLSYGSVFLTRKDSRISSIADMQEKVLVGNRPLGFYGYVVPIGEIARHGYKPKDFFSKEIFLDSGSHNVLASLLRGEGDVATVPSCFLEDNYPEDHPFRKDLKPINVLESKPCVRSTPAYPNWAFSSSPGASPEVARDVLKTLLDMPTDSKGYRWSIATNFSGTDQLYKDLKEGMYIILNEWSLKTFFKEYKHWFFSLTVLLICLAGYSALLNYLVRKKTRQLQRSIKHQQVLQKRSRDSEAKFESLQKLGIIGQMSSMIAHELRQPLSTLRLYAQGLQRKLERGEWSIEQSSEVLSKIVTQAERAEQIVQSVRNYAKSKRSEKQEICLTEIVNNALYAFKQSGRFRRNVIVSIAEDIRLFANPMEFELAILNLLRNSADSLASLNHKDPKIELAVRRNGDFAEIEVKDNGVKVSEADLQAAVVPLRSNKENGLGIGLSLVNNIMENHGGSLVLHARKEGGVTAVLSLRILER
ncbi:sensor histidine kinase [Turicimonas muris]|uniref:sensor histidine kinase n=1 Tax=Turicimonas muris TaxID=1796652 RepID=UPI0019177A52|nr:PhnD/SsuA/transferrin family substrate-binding protein [Turicimonas muris]QQQ95729.1 PhnD/SsuA/transferrin family substrate-binding protein [Turicimonas muris]